MPTIQPPSEAVTVIVDPSAEKPGLQTTEFWLTLLAQGAALAAQYQGSIPPPWGVVAAVALGAVYTCARAILKSRADENAAKVAIAKVGAAADIAVAKETAVG